VGVNGDELSPAATLTMVCCMSINLDLFLGEGSFPCAYASIDPSHVGHVLHGPVSPFLNNIN
jgi:hypothetical protein